LAKDVAKRQFRGERGGGRECVCAKRYEMRGRVRRPASGSGTDERKKKLLADQTGELTSHVGRWGRENAESSVPVRGLAGTPSPAKKKTLHIDATNGQEGRKEGRYGGRKGRK